MTRSILPLLLLASTSPLAACEGSDWSAIERLRPGQPLEVVDAAMKTHHGAFGAAGHEDLTVQTASGPLLLKRTEVARVTLRENSRRARHALIGAAIGAGAGLAVAAIVNPRFANEGRGNLVYGIATPLGVGLGAAVGTAAPGFETIYRTDPKTLQRPEKN